MKKVEDFIGDKIDARVFSVDKIEDCYLLLSAAGRGGYSNLWIHENNTTTQLLFPEDKKAVIKQGLLIKSTFYLGT